MKKFLLFTICLLCIVSVKQAMASKTQGACDTVLQADPTIFVDKGVYYLYGTGSKDGILVYSSVDLQHWTGPIGNRGGHALFKGDSYGTEGFWAPQVFKYRHKYYMAYTANEHIAIAESDSPLGPFIQKVKKAISGNGKQIDPFVFRDTNGALYLFHVRLQDGNRIFVARLRPDLSDIDSGATKECLHAELPWENTAASKWPVSEGPSVLKYKKLYYLFYTANDYRSIDYAVGYATANSPFGPWTKMPGNPLISRKNTGINGTGHGDFFWDTNGGLYYVLHTHNSDTRVSPRKTAIIKAAFNKDHPVRMTVDTSSFHFLLLK